MRTIRCLSDVIGARLTNSPAQRRANRWTKEQLEKWGMKNAVVDPWGEFGRGWKLKRFCASVSTPDKYVSFRAYPHPKSDELFIVVEGCLAIDLENGRELRLRPWESVTIPAMTVHRTRAIG